MSEASNTGFYETSSDFYVDGEFHSLKLAGMTYVFEMTEVCGLLLVVSGLHIQL